MFNRGRINVERPSVRPLRPGPRISLGGRNRLPTVTKAPAAEEAETSPSPSSTASPVAEDAQPSNGEVSFLNVLTFNLRSFGKERVGYSDH